jgi:primosomal protein N' (replication factor Y)
MFATVIPETKTFGNESFSYIIPNNLRGLLSIGSIVHIPFGKRKIRGVVAGFEKDISTDYTLREIDRMEERMTLPPYYLDIARWVSKYYLCSLGEAIGLFLPPNITKPRATKEHSCKDTSDARNVILSAEQKNISDSLIKSLKNPQKPALLHGVTGSGNRNLY